MDDDDLEKERLYPVVYDYLCALAGRYDRGFAGSVEPASVVNEAFVKLLTASDGGAEWESEEHFRAVAALALRQILVDRARRRTADKRGGGWERVTLTDVKAASRSREVDILALDGALHELGALDDRQLRIVELRFFGGLSIPQIARELELSESTVEKEWKKAREWLEARLGSEPQGS